MSLGHLRNQGPPLVARPLAFLPCTTSQSDFQIEDLLHHMMGDQLTSLLPLCNTNAIYMVWHCFFRIPDLRRADASGTSNTNRDCGWSPSIPQ